MDKQKIDLEQFEAVLEEHSKASDKKIYKLIFVLYGGLIVFIIAYGLAFLTGRDAGIMLAIKTNCSAVLTGV